MTKKNVTRILIAVLAIAVLAIGATAVFAQDGDEPPAPEGAPGFGYRFPRQFGHGRIGGPFGIGDHKARLAEALGITVEALEDAHAAVQETVLAEAVEAGLLTQEQADDIAALGAPVPFGRMNMGPRGGFGPGLGIDAEALLADELGISVETLQEARAAARAAGIAQAVEEGLLTEEQADLMAARQALKDYIDKDALLAEALGISVEELQAAKEDGARVADLIDELGLDMATVHENVAAAHEGAVEAAVEAGVITQEQADQLGAFGQFGLRGHGPGRACGGRGFRGAPGYGRFQPENGGVNAPAFDA